MKKKTIFIIVGVILTCLIAGGILLAVFLNREEKDAEASFREYISDLGVTEPSLREAHLLPSIELEINGHFAHYVRIYNLTEIFHPELILDNTFQKVEKELGNYKGKLFQQKEGNWYTVKNAVSLRYLIRKDEAGKLSVWEFICFNDDRDLNDDVFITYLYEEVLSTIYSVRSASDIESIAFSPYLEDNGPWVPSQREAGDTIVIRDEETIQSFYSILAKAECGGIHYGFDLTWDEDPARYHGEPGQILSFRLRIECRNGAVIDSLLYSGDLGCFSELFGISIRMLSDEDMAVMNRMTGIQK